MDIAIILKSVTSLLIVFVIMYALLILIRKYGKLTKYIQNTKTKNLTIEEVLYIDASNKIVIVSNEKKSYYLIAIGKSEITVIDKYLV